MKKNTHSKPRLAANENVAPPADANDIDCLLTGIHTRYGYDFSQYSRASLLRRLEKIMSQADVKSYDELLDTLLGNTARFDEFLKAMSITVTEMFRDPKFYKALREKIIPILATFPFIKIWHAGCATGEEVYSMAILLHEEGFLKRTRLYATDFNKQALDTAQKGIYVAKNLDLYTANYRAAGGKSHFSDYVTQGYDHAKIADYLKEQITFSYHNLVTDGVFGEMNLILCRNVLIYFGKNLQNQVLSLFTQSLRHGGFLCLGNKESLNFTAIKPLFNTIDLKQKIYKKYKEDYV